MTSDLLGTPAEPIDVYPLDLAVGEPMIDRWELRAARRALANLKALCGGESMMKLIDAQIADGDRFHADLINASGGELRAAHTTLTIHGIDTNEFQTWMGAQFTAGFDEAEQLAAHPEHYVMPPAYDGRGMVELIGGYPTRFYIEPLTGGLPDRVATFLDSAYPVRLMPAALTLDDGTIFAYALHQARDTMTGLELDLRILYPAAAPKTMIDGHCEHLAIEFRHYVQGAAGPDRELTITARTPAGSFTESAIDEWELKAARRCLMNLKTLLAGQPMMDLLADQIAAGDQFHKELINASGGTYRQARTDLTVHGLSGTDFISWFASALSSGFEKALNRAAHPEHYVEPPQYPAGIVETIGGYPTRMKVCPGGDLPSAISDYLDSDYPLTIGVAVLRLDDDTPVAYAVHQARDTAIGSDIALRILYHSAAPDAMIEGHREHLAIEFRKYLQAAAQATVSQP